MLAQRDAREHLAALAMVYMVYSYYGRDDEEVSAFARGSEYQESFLGRQMEYYGPGYAIDTYALNRIPLSGLYARAKVHMWYARMISPVGLSLFAIGMLEAARRAI